MATVMDKQRRLKAELLLRVLQVKGAMKKQEVMEFLHWPASEFTKNIRWLYRRGKAEYNFDDRTWVAK